MKTTARISLLFLLIGSLLGQAHASDVINLSGEWDAVLRTVTYGEKKHLVEESYLIKVRQDADNIVCECLTSGKRLSKGEEILKAKLIGPVFDSVYINAVQDPVKFTLAWVKGNGVILDHGGTIIAQVFNEMHESDVTITMKRKDRQ